MDFLEDHNKESTNTETSAAELAQGFFKSSTEGDFVPTSTLAAEFGYDQIHIARVAREGKVQGIKKDNQWLVSRSSLKSYSINAAENKRLAGLASIKIPKNNFYNKLSGDVFKELPATLASYRKRGDDISNYRREQMSKFFSPTLVALQEFKVGFESSFDKASRQVMEILPEVFTINRGSIPTIKVPKINSSLVWEDYLKRQQEVSQNRMDKFSKFFHPTLEFLSEFCLNFANNFYHLTEKALADVEIQKNLSWVEKTKSIFSRRLAPSLVLSQIAEHLGAKRVSSKISDSDTLKLILFALFVLFVGVGLATISPIEQKGKSIEMITFEYNVSNTVAKAAELSDPILENLYCDNIYYKKISEYNNSIVQFLDFKGQSSFFEDRLKLASDLGILDYHGTSSQNLALLKALLIKYRELPVAGCNF